MSMDTESLIAALAADPTPPPRAARLLTQIIGLGAAVAAVLTLTVLGPRHDTLAAMSGWQSWAKFTYPLALAICGLALVGPLSRPGGIAGWRKAWLVLPFAVMASLALSQWLGAPPDARAHLFWGHSWRLCPWLIIAVSTPVFIASVIALKKLAPTRPVAAGAAAGFFAGAAGAWIYGFHCGETALVFIAFWYTLGIAAVTALGALTGRWLLRW